MKVAFYSYPSAFQNPGGGEVQLLKTKEGLEKKGITVKLFDQWRDKLEDYDILHVFGSVKDCAGLMQTAKNIDTCVVLSTIFWSSFKRAFYEDRSFQRKIDLTLRHFAKLLLPGTPSGRRKTMQIADMLLPNSDAEAQQLTRLFSMPSRKITVVPNGVDEKFKYADARLFKSKYQFSDFTLAVGRIEPRKNQLNLIRAFRNLDRTLVIVGNPVSDYAHYYKQCVREAGKNVHFLGGIDHEDPLLASAYAASSVFVAPGWFETPGLAALEAGLCASRIAITKYGCTEEYFKDFAQYFDPSSVASIKNAVLVSYKKEPSKVLIDHILKHYTWDNVADLTLKAYKKAQGQKP